MTQFTVPGMSNKEGAEVAELLQKALSRTTTCISR